MTEPYSIDLSNNSDNLGLELLFFNEIINIETNQTYTIASEEKINSPSRKRKKKSNFKLSDLHEALNSIQTVIKTDEVIDKSEIIELLCFSLSNETFNFGSVEILNFGKEQILEYLKLYINLIDKNMKDLESINSYNKINNLLNQQPFISITKYIINNRKCFKIFAEIPIDKNYYYSIIHNFKIKELLGKHLNTNQYMLEYFSKKINLKLIDINFFLEKEDFESIKFINNLYNYTYLLESNISKIICEFNDITLEIIKYFHSLNYIFKDDILSYILEKSDIKTIMFLISQKYKFECRIPFNNKSLSSIKYLTENMIINVNDIRRTFDICEITFDIIQYLILLECNISSYIKNIINKSEINIIRLLIGKYEIKNNHINDINYIPINILDFLIYNNFVNKQLIIQCIYLGKWEHLVIFSKYKIQLSHNDVFIYLFDIKIDSKEYLLIKQLKSLLLQYCKQDDIKIISEMIN